MDRFSGARSIRDNLKEVVQFEESLYAVSVPEAYGDVVELLKGVIGEQVEKLKRIPSSLDEVILYIDSSSENETDTKVFKETITFELPEGWEKRMNHAVRKVQRNQIYEGYGGSLTLFFLIILVVVYFIV